MKNNKIVFVCFCQACNLLHLTKEIVVCVTTPGSKDLRVCFAYYLHPTIFITFTRTQLHSVSLVATASFCSWDPKDVGKMCDQAVTPINLVMPKIYQHQHREPCVLQYNLYDASRRWADPIEGISLSHC